MKIEESDVKSSALMYRQGEVRDKILEGKISISPCRLHAQVSTNLDRS